MMRIGRTKVMLYEARATIRHKTKYETQQIKRQTQKSRTRRANVMLNLAKAMTLMTQKQLQSPPRPPKISSFRPSRLGIYEKLKWGVFAFDKLIL